MATPTDVGIASAARFGSCRLLRRLAVGGMSEVHLAYDEESGEEVVVKLPAVALQNSVSFLERFRAECALTCVVRHPHLVAGLASGVEATMPYLVLEFVDGPNLQTVLDRRGKLAWRRTLGVVRQVALGLDCLHSQGFVHRDVKPGNILINSHGEAKLADFGVAKHWQSVGDLTALDQAVGTPYYMPPEQTLHASSVDPRSDLYALGATWFHLLTGEVPFAGDDENAIFHAKQSQKRSSVRSVRPEVPAAVDAVLDRLLARHPSDRFSSAGAFVEFLDASGLTGSEPMAEAMEESSDLPPTRVDLTKPADPTPDLQIWLLRYQRDEAGPWRRLKARTGDAVRLYRAALIPETALAARLPTTRFRRLLAYPEFRGLTYGSERE